MFQLVALAQRRSKAAAEAVKSLSYETVPVPTPEAGQVLVRVHYASVDPMDWKLLSGEFRDLFPKCKLRPRPVESSRSACRLASCLAPLGLVSSRPCLGRSPRSLCISR